MTCLKENCVQEIWSEVAIHVKVTSVDIQMFTASCVTAGYRGHRPVGEPAQFVPGQEQDHKASRPGHSHQAHMFQCTGEAQVYLCFL